MGLTIHYAIEANKDWTSRQIRQKLEDTRRFALSLSVVSVSEVVEFRGKWYVFYHTSELSNGNSYRRSVCVDELTFAEDGKINVVTPTHAGPAPLPAR